MSRGGPQGKTAEEPGSREQGRRPRVSSVVPASHGEPSLWTQARLCPSDGARAHSAYLLGRWVTWQGYERAEKHKESRNQHLPPLMGGKRKGMKEPEESSTRERAERMGPGKSFLLQRVRWRTRLWKEVRGC